MSSAKWRLFCLGLIELTHLSLDKMAADNIFKGILMKVKFCILIRIPLTFFLMVPIDSKPALVEVMAWRLTGNKPLPEPIPTEFILAYMRH